MAGSLTRRAVLLAKVQSAEGVAATLDPSLHAILISDLNWNPNGEQVERNFLRDSLSPLPYRQGRKLFEATFSFELKSGPAIGARPEWSPLMRAAGMSETVTGATVTSIRTAALKWTAAGNNANAYYVDLLAGGDPTISNPQVVRENGDDMRRNSVSVATLQPGEFFYGDDDTLGFSTVYVRLSDDTDPDGKALGFVETVESATDITYNFKDTNHEVATIGLYIDGILISCVDSLIDITSINHNAGQITLAQARLQAKYATPTDVAMPAALYQSHLPPIAQSMAFTIDGFSAGVIPSWSVNFANQIAERRDVNSANGFKGLRYVGRQPTGQVTMEQELVATWPAITRWENANELAWSAVLGSTPQRLGFSGPNAQITTVQSTDINGIRGWNLGLRFNAPSTTKEFQLKCD